MQVVSKGRQLAWNVKTCFLRKIRKIFQNVSAEIFTQSAKREHEAKQMGTNNIELSKTFDLGLPCLKYTFLLGTYALGHVLLYITP